MMNDEELEELIACDAVSMKTPHAKKFRRSVMASRTISAPASSEGDIQSS